jgi:CubicO group peptidase (beta-lactamase class C family)
MDAIVAADRIVLGRGPEGRALPSLDLDPAGLAGILVTPAEGPPATAAEILRRHQSVALVVVHRGRLAYEWYAAGADPDTLRPCFSITKSFTGTLAATAAHEGVLERSSRLGDVLGELGGSGFADATVGQAADMSVAIAYTEDYLEAGAGPSSEGQGHGFGDYIAALAPDAAVPLRELLGRIGAGDRPHGEAFAYATPTTDALGWALERARDQRYPELLAALWSQVGAEHDAALTRAPDGTPLLGVGLLATTRDLARAGVMLAGESTVPAAVIEGIRAGGDPDVFQRGGRYSYMAGYAYRDQWWMPGGPNRPLSAWGIHGQLLWIDPEAELVVACHSGGPHPSSRQRDLDHDALCRALTEAAATWPG